MFDVGTLLRATVATLVAIGTEEQTTPAVMGTEKLFFGSVNLMMGGGGQLWTNAILGPEFCVQRIDFPADWSPWYEIVLFAEFPCWNWTRLLPPVTTKLLFPESCF